MRRLTLALLLCVGPAWGFRPGGFPGFEAKIKALGAVACWLTSDGNAAATSREIISARDATAGAGATSGSRSIAGRGYGRAWSFVTAANSKLTVPHNAAFNLPVGSLIVLNAANSSGADSPIYAKDDCGTVGWGLLWGSGNTIFLYNRGAPTLTYVGSAHDSAPHVIGLCWDSTELDVTYDLTVEVARYPWRSPANASNQVEIGAELNGGCSAQPASGQRIQYLALFNVRLGTTALIDAARTLMP